MKEGRWDKPSHPNDQAPGVPLAPAASGLRLVASLLPLPVLVTSWDPSWERRLLSANPFLQRQSDKSFQVGTLHRFLSGIYF